MKIFYKKISLLIERIYKILLFSKEQQLGNMEVEVRNMQMELANVQKERLQLEQQRKLLKCTGPCAPCACCPPPPSICVTPMPGLPSVPLKESAVPTASIVQLSVQFSQLNYFSFKFFDQCSFCVSNNMSFYI